MYIASSSSQIKFNSNDDENNATNYVNFWQAVLKLARKAINHLKWFFSSTLDYLRNTYMYVHLYIDKLNLSIIACDYYGFSVSGVE